MINFSKHIKAIVFFFIISVLGFNSVGHAQLKQNALDKIAELNGLIATADAKGINTLKEKTTVRSATIFLRYADWDENNIALNTQYFETSFHYKDNAVAEANALADGERQQIVTMLELSIVTIKKLISGEYKRIATPNVNWANVTHEGDQMTYEGRPVFLADWTWKPGTPEFDEFHGQLDGYYLSLKYAANENGGVFSNRISEITNKGMGKAGFIFMDQSNVPSWAVSKYGSDFVLKDDGNARYTKFDIDHPGAREMMGSIVKGYFPSMKNKKFTELGYMLCNEPHFITSKEEDGKLRWASTGVSNYSIEKFKIWLRNKHATIQALNALWGTSFVNFDAVTIDVPISLGERGTPKWYDWMTFNKYRVTKWYEFLKDTILKVNPAAKVHLKLIPGQWTGNSRDHGLDFESLTRMSGIIGNDAAADHRSYPWRSFEWEEKYKFDWRELAMSYDFFKSVSPNKMMFNSEAHFLSTGASLDLNLSPKHARATYWMAHQMGMTASQNWYWARREDGSKRSGGDRWYMGSSNHLPSVVNEVHTTMLDLNAYAEEIMTFQRQRKPIRLFYTEASALNKTNHMDNIFELYESLFFKGIPLGFVTENILKLNNSSDWDVVLVYKTEYVTQGDITRLQQYIDAGGKVIMDEVSFTKDEYGRNISPLTGNFTRVSSLENMLTSLENAAAEPLIKLVETSSVAHPICTWKVVKNKEGKPVVSVINVGKVNATVTLDLKNPKIGTVLIDLINGVEKSNQQVLEPNDVLFVALEDGILSAETYVQNSNEIFVSPNPVKNNVNFEFQKFQKNVMIELFDVSGKKIFSRQFSDTKNVDIDMSNLETSIYIVHILKEGGTKFFKLIKS